MFSLYWKKRVNEESFRKNLQYLYKGFWETIENYQITDITFFLEYQMNSYYKESNISEGSRFADNIRPHIIEIFTQWFFNEKLSFRERIHDDTWEAWKKYSQKTIELPPEFIESIMKQPAIKELFTDVIHNAIIAFTKKLNPFFNAVSSLGIDKQIREFIVPFMDNVVDIATSFVASEENQGLFEELNSVILENLAHLKPETLRSIDLAKWSEDIVPLIDKTLQDKKFQETSKDTFSSFLKVINNQYKNQTLKEVIGDHEMMKTIKDHSFSMEEINMIIPFFMNENVMKFIEEEIKEYEK